MYQLKEGDVVTRTNGPYKGTPLKVISVCPSLSGNGKDQISCTVIGNEEINVRGTRRSFIFHKDFFGNAYDKSMKLCSCWRYMQSKYARSMKDGDYIKQLYDWHHIRNLACHLNDCNRVEDIPDENVEKTIEFCKKVIDLYFDF